MIDPFSKDPGLTDDDLGDISYGPPLGALRTMFDLPINPKDNSSKNEYLFNLFLRTLSYFRFWIHFTSPNWECFKRNNGWRFGYVYRIFAKPQKVVLVNRLFIEDSTGWGLDRSVEAFPQVRSSHDENYFRIYMTEKLLYLTGRTFTVSAPYFATKKKIYRTIDKCESLEELEMRLDLYGVNSDGQVYAERIGAL